MIVSLIEALKGIGATDNKLMKAHAKADHHNASSPDACPQARTGGQVRTGVFWRSTRADGPAQRGSDEIDRPPVTPPLTGLCGTRALPKRVAVPGADL